MPKISELSDPGSSHNLTGQEKIVAVTASLSTISLSASDLVGRSIDNIATGSVSNFKATHTDFNANSAFYDSAYSTVNASSARNERTATSVETNVVPSTGNWNRTAASVETNVVPSTGNWNRTAASVATHVVPNTANWTTGYNSTQTELKSNSASWTTGYNSTQTELKGNSASWTTGYNSTQTELKSNSASWNYVATNSATLQSDTTVSGALSGNSTLIINGRGTFGGDHIVTDNILTVFGNISAQGTIYASGSALGEVNPVNPGGSNRTIQYNDSNAFGGAAQFAYDEVNHNVGIGTQAIAIADNIHEKLTVAGNISATGKLYNEDGEVGQVTPGGADGAIQFNNSSTLSGNANLTFDDSNVRLGIGTAAPDQKLEVAGGQILVKDTSGDASFKAWAGGSSDPRLQFTVEGATDYVIGLDNSEGDALKFSRSSTVGTSTQMTISGNGMVGIGTATPTSILNVEGTTNDGNSLVQLTQAGTGRGLGVNRNVSSATRQMVSFAQLHSSGGSQPVVHIQQADTDEIALGVDTSGTVAAPTFCVKGDGSVGINTADPDHKLHIVGSSGTSNMVRLSCGPTASSGTLINAHQNTNSDGIVVDSTGTGSPLILKDSGTATFIVKDGGNVGIGTDNPAAKLHVNAGTLAVSGANAALEVHNTTGNTLLTLKSSHDPSLELRANQTGFTFQNAATDTAILRLNENGNVGIGPLPAEPTKELSVLGAISASETIYGQSLSIDANVPEITLTDLDASGTPYAKFQASAGGLEIAADDGDEITGSTISMQVDNKVIATLSGGDASTSGSFGIGTTIPAYKLHVAAPNTSTIAVSAFGEIHAGGDIVSSSSSDRRQKTNIKKLDNALDKVLTLDGVEYDWNEMAAAHRIGKHDVGVIAQQVEEVLPDAVEHRETGMMAVRYERLVPLLIEAIKELKSEIDELKGK